MMAYFIKSLACSSLNVYCCAATMERPNKQIVENGFPACKNSQIFETPAAMESKDCEDLKKVRRFPMQF